MQFTRVARVAGEAPLRRSSALPISEIDVWSSKRRSAPSGLTRQIDRTAVGGTPTSCASSRTQSSPSPD